MKKTYKIVPFDIELAKKIQAGEIEGKIKTKKGNDVRVVCWDVLDSNYVILALITIEDHEIYASYTKGGFIYIDAKNLLDLVLEVPDNEPQNPQYNSPSIEQLSELKNYTEQLMEVNRGVIDNLNNMVQELRKTCNLSLKTEFKPFDKVLVRSYDNQSWQPAFYSHNEGDKYVMTSRYFYEQCIPYEGNQELVGTCNEPKCK